MEAVLGLDKWTQLDADDPDLYNFDQEVIIIIISIIIIIKIIIIIIINLNVMKRGIVFC